MIPEDAVQLPKTAKFVWLIHDVIWFLFTFIGLATVYILFLQSKRDIYTNIALVFMLIVVSIPLIHMALINYFYHFRRYYIDDHAVYIYRGFVFRKVETIPLNRIQNVDTTQGPILHQFKLMDLSIKTAAHGFKIREIEELTAKKMRGQLVIAALHAREVASDD